MDRLILAVVSLVVAPVAAFVVGSWAAQTAADGPVVVLGGGTAIAIPIVAARSFGRTWPQASRWAVASLAATGVLFLLVVALVIYLVRPS